MVGGRLIYVMGPSGAGKDSVLRRASPELERRGVRIARRTITRPPDANENNTELSTDAFRARDEAGGFALTWEAHGHHYGIDMAIDEWLDAGSSVVVNGSRAHLPMASRRYGERLVPVLITADPSVIAERLAQRGRESTADQQQRTARSAALANVDHPGLVMIDNSGDLDDAVAAFLELVKPPPS